MSAKQQKKVTTSHKVTTGHNDAGHTNDINDKELKNQELAPTVEQKSSAQNGWSQQVTPQAQVGHNDLLSSVTSTSATNKKTRSDPITREDVAERYMKLVKDGITPTVRLIYASLKRGSFRTLEKFFAEFDHEYRRQQLEKAEQPNNLSDFENVLVQTLSKVCYETKVKRYEAKIQTMQAVIEKLEDTNIKEQGLLCENLEATQKELSDAQAVIEILNKEKIELQNRLTDALNENSKLKNVAKESKSDLKHYRELVQLIIRSSQDPDLPKTLANKIQEDQ